MPGRCRSWIDWVDVKSMLDLFPQQDWCRWQVCSDRMDQSSVSCIDTFDSVPLGTPKHFSQHRPWVNWIDPVSAGFTIRETQCHFDSPVEGSSVWIYHWMNPMSAGFLKLDSQHRPRLNWMNPVRIGVTSMTVHTDSGKSEWILLACSNVSIAIVRSEV